MLFARPLNLINKMPNANWIITLNLEVSNQNNHFHTVSNRS